MARGDFLVVLGDFHGGDNPLAQGLFGLRHPDPAAMLRRIAAEAGPGVHLSPPRRGVVEMTARSWPMYPRATSSWRPATSPRPPGTRRVALEDVVVDDGHVSDRAGSFRVPLAQFLYLPIFVAALRSFDPVGEGRGRAQIGRLVVRRASWSAPAAELPAAPDELAAWARERGLPRRVFARSPLERKPRYVDFESPSLLRTLVRFLAPAREQAPAAPSSSPRCSRPRRLLARERRRPPHERAARRRRRSLASGRRAAAASPALSGLASDTVAAAISCSDTFSG